MSKVAKNPALDASVLAGLQAECPNLPANILEIVAKLPDVIPRKSVASLLSQLDGDIAIEVRRAAISQVAGMFRYAYAIDRVRERDYDVIEEYLGQLLRASYE